jgi:hypothetical protein
LHIYSLNIYYQNHLPFVISHSFDWILHSKKFIFNTKSIIIHCINLTNVSCFLIPTHCFCFICYTWNSV